MTFKFRSTRSELLYIVFIKIKVFQIIFFAIVRKSSVIISNNKRYLFFVISQCSYFFFCFKLNIYKNKGA
ncbi:hypothetical protein C1645_526760 [Glomus cerebriforme]|uniref:Uncharacterized protein n=1 Tax=Glomus cerebriforme TaxID=658196 RepID=A0A397SB93_9GLOM|nr:hypothetical protein C1645_526760 [Glomus cerebriforme]